MTVETRRPLEEYLALDYPFEVLADPEGGYVIRFPDLPGCMSQVETLDELPRVVDEVRSLWIETEYELGNHIPLPTYPEEYSGKFNVRISRTLHRSLADAAKRNSVSLNHYVSELLARGDAQARLEHALQGLRGDMVGPGRSVQGPRGTAASGAKARAPRKSSGRST
ncbi:MAG: type II toxin-antitoxin system HicB family antitoxin [Chloroflexi bacterium]|nr:type II toxin-antitoxin system HicB family antitoxin [Chloroflexota bacterium]